MDVLEKTRDKLSRKEIMEIDATTRPFVDKICETTKQFDSPKRFDALHVFRSGCTETRRIVRWVICSW